MTMVSYASVATKNRDISASRYVFYSRVTFSKFVMFFIAVSKLGCAKVIFVEPAPRNQPAETVGPYR